MSEGKSNFLESRDQSNCLMCGRCCRVATTPVPYDELRQLAEDSDEGAMDFFELFEPYQSIEEAKAVDARIVDNILSAIKTDDIYSEKDITFYRCKYILENNLCGIYENRKELCDRFPSSAWAVVPPGCGFEKWLQEKREETKQLVIEQKENLIIAESLLSEAVTLEQKQRVEVTIEKIKRTISFYDKYGAKDW